MSYVVFFYDCWFDLFCDIYGRVVKVYFVFEENWYKLEMNFVMELLNVEIIVNFYNVLIDFVFSWLEFDELFKFVCVGWIYFVLKG